MYSVVKEFNQLPHDVRELGLPRFKSELRRYLLSAQVTQCIVYVVNGAWFVTECDMCATPCVTLCTAEC